MIVTGWIALTLVLTGIAIKVGVCRVRRGENPR